MIKLHNSMIITPKEIKFIKDINDLKKWEDYIMNSLYEYQILIIVNKSLHKNRYYVKEMV